MNPLKRYPKIHALIYLVIFIWILYMTIRGEPYFWIFAILFGLILLYWIWKALTGK